ncbi:hypothetical protein LSAT2_020292 [Lamellibrachia satsuma]|nr:hypothetical protein LSAT2_020292 [Lamellibrachia satsuma]
MVTGAIHGDSQLFIYGQVNCVIVEKASYNIRVSLVQGNHGTMDPSSGHFWCVKCKQGFPTQDELTLHKKVHERMYRYRCPYCDKGFSSSSNRRGHLAKHTLKKEYACTLCGYEYVYRKNLVYHMRRHHDKDFS